MRTPLAWKNLSGDPRRFLLGSAGVGFAVVLMFMQNGFRNALLDSPVQVVEMFEADLIASNSAWYSLVSERRISSHLLTRAASHGEVEWVAPLYLEKARSRIRVKDWKARAIRVLAFPNNPGVVREPEIAAKMRLLDQPMSALVDRRSKSVYGFALNDHDRLNDQIVELMDRRIKIVDTIKIGSDFANDGNMIVSTDTFSRCFPFRGDGNPLSQVDFALIKLKRPSDANRVAAKLTSIAPDQWMVRTRAEFIKKEVGFWRSQTPIGMIFFVGVAMGFAVGVIVCYQILYTNIHDSMSELATLKAMGYTNVYFLNFVIKQSVYLSIAGFVPALVLSYGLFVQLEIWAGLPMLLTPWRILSTYGLTLVMCVLSGVLAVRKIWQTDPASLF